MVKSINTLLEDYKEYGDPYGKIRREVNNNSLFPIIRGLYETDDNTNGLLLASVIYGPSYVSFEYALSYHGLIPERVYLYTNATYGKNRRKLFKTSFGNFSYRDIPKNAYPFGIEVIEKDGYVIFMAKPEKALLDKLYITKPVNNIKELEDLLFNDLRIDYEKFLSLNKSLVNKLAEGYSSKNIKIFLRLIGGEEYEYDY